MTDLDLTKAIEAGARALHDHDPRSYSETFETCCAREWELRDAEVALDAMLPHIREQLADLVIDFAENSGRRGALANVVFSIRDTANLVRGKANE